MVIKKLLSPGRKKTQRKTRRFGNKRITLDKERKFNRCKREVRKRNKKLPPNKRVNPFAVCRSALQI